MNNEFRLKKTTRRNLSALACGIAGATLTAFATKYIYDPSGLVTGGVSGLCIIIRQLSDTWFGWPVPLWLSNTLLNIPIFLFAIWSSGWKGILRTAAVWLLMTVELAWFPDAALIPDNLLLVTIYGGICFGAGCGLLLSAEATSGGTDLLGYTLHRYIRSVSVGRLIQILDGCVVAAGALVFGIERTLIAVISVYVMGKVIDAVVSRGRSAKMALIISEESEKIASEIMSSLDRGVTGLKGQGMYTSKDKTVLVCICSNRDIVSIKDIVSKYDSKAFFTVTNVSEAMGEGFVEEWQGK
ncbi:MAG: YitT family protein [Eubacteriales bacterium]|nr:YitT family protein [Eubacteriales bacterium]